MEHKETWGEVLTRLNTPGEFGISPLYTDFLMSMGIILAEAARARLMHPVYKVTTGGSVLQDADKGYDRPDWVQIRDVLIGNDFQRNASVSVQCSLFIGWLYKRPFPDEMVDKEMLIELAREWNIFAEEAG